MTALLAGDQDAVERAAGMLCPLALGGSAEARDALREYVRHGEHWTDVLEEMAAAWPVVWWDDLADVARARLDGERPDLWRSEPWVRWRDRIPVRVPGPRSGGHAYPLDLRSDLLLARLADPDAPERARTDALRLLSDRPAEPALLPLVPTLGSADGERPLPLLPRAVRRLGALAVPAAREWARDERAWLSWTGVAVLTEHGDSQDVPVLVAELEADWQRTNWCGPKVIADGLARFGPAAAEAAPLLRRYWALTPHSYERPAYLKALAAIDPAGIEPAYVESLWDCEEEARLLGIASAPDLPSVRERVAALADDPMERPDVREAANARIHGRG
ncbi:MULTISPECIES: hypothetical protein [Streptomyces]|uniref:Uncharacterized protein n=1 Tax=Streptomyces solicathayae TaxID=3081768 RepID=A0ABZ0M291_9ACTN|nr:hypothetical protein [Streptomyces sp. HUAS YS2]WOX25884.1 hypothetical protein R2D22_32690 [Streptomyces sp. HUAS YS2]